MNNFHFPFSIFQLRGFAGRLVKHPLFAGSAIMIIGNNFVNFGNYVYHLLMGRLLGPASYGELAAILSLLVLLWMFPNSLGLVIVKFTSAAKTREEVNALASWLQKTVLVWGLVVSAVVFLLSPAIARFLHIVNPVVVSIIAPTFLMGILAFFNRSLLQGLMRFGRMVITLVLEVLLKLTLGIGLVFLGYSVFGAITGVLIGALFGFILTRIFLRDYLKDANGKPELISMFKYAVPVLFVSVATVSMFSTDLVLVKHFLSAHDAGLYASLSMLGRIIFFGAAPISSVMFPIVSKRQSEGGRYQKIFFYSIALTLAISLGVLSVYWILPELAINLLYGSLYLEASGLLVWFGLFMTLFTLSSLLASYQLSLGNTSVAVLPITAALLQAVGIWFIHDSLLSVIRISIFASGLLLVSLLLYFGYATAKEAS